MIAELAGNELLLIIPKFHLSFPLSHTQKIRPAPIRYDEDHYQDEEDGFGFGIQSRPISNPNLIWPCVTCSPGNLSGYTCLHPIPTPSPDLLTINDHSPTIGQRWPPLNASNSIHHAQCEACSKYVPRFSGERSSYCAACLVYSCEPFEQNGCPQPNEDTNLDLLPEASYDDCSIRNLSSNVGIAGFQFLNDEISEEEREKVEKKLEEFLEYTDEKALCEYNEGIKLNLVRDDECMPRLIAGILSFASVCSTSIS